MICPHCRIPTEPSRHCPTCGSALLPVRGNLPANFSPSVLRLWATLLWLTLGASYSSYGFAEPGVSPVLGSLWVAWGIAGLSVPAWLWNGGRVPMGMQLLTLLWAFLTGLGCLRVLAIALALAFVSVSELLAEFLFV